MIENMNSKITTNSQLSRIVPKNKDELSKQLEQEQIHRTGDNIEGYQQGERGGEQGKRHRE